jgi:hypothetical protein
MDFYALQQFDFNQPQKRTSGSKNGFSRGAVLPHPTTLEFPK